MRLAPGYVAQDDIPFEAILDGYAPFYGANLAVTFLVNEAEKDEQQCLSTLCGRDHRSKSIARPFTSQVLAFYLAETRQVIGQITGIAINSFIKCAKYANLIVT